MKANKKFFGVMFVVNMILGIIGFLLMWAVRAMTQNSIIGIVICSVIFMGIAVYLNIYVVKRAKLKTPYFIFGAVVNAVFVFVPTALMMLL